MKCCIECFKDIHIRNTIEKQGSIGDCDYCSHKNIAVYDVSSIPNPIADIIVGLIQIYSVSDLPDAKPLKVALHDDWDIFNAGIATIQTLSVDLCSPVINSNSDVFTKNVIISQLLDDDFIREFCVVRGLSWEQFAESIKYENRFHSGMFNADAFSSFLSIITKSYSTGAELYRARIAHTPNGYTTNEMCAPPKEKRSAGRINPEGIGVLYLSSDGKTVLNEVRASTFDYVSIGAFKLTKDIKVVNLSGISETSPFLYEGELEKYAANRKVFREIAHEIAKPLRRSDSPIEYLPTQYIAEFIKSQGYDGVEYASTLRESGNNIAVFDETLFECVSVQTIEVSEVSYKTEPNI
ncbi:MAG: RES family NAD+ phosphorylase [Oscillospiraceae bacterium]|nr:RES family NAD+ phosphorylase [Oscillospiraceae bacterium]